MSMQAMLTKNKPPMTVDEARENIEIMRAKTAVKAQIALLKLAGKGVGNFTDEAREIYAARLSELSA